MDDTRHGDPLCWSAKLNPPKRSQRKKRTLREESTPKLQLWEPQTSTFPKLFNGSSHGGDSRHVFEEKLKTIEQ